MKGIPCTIQSDITKLDVLAHFPSCLTTAEEDDARMYFEHFVFFRTEGKGVRRCVCTSCMEGFWAEKEISPDFFKVTHGKPCTCPRCGQSATLQAMGKFRNFNSLNSHIRGVQISAYNGGVMIQAGWLKRDFDDEDLGGTINFEPYKRYYFAPGVRGMWVRQTYNDFGDRYSRGGWEWRDSVREPFQKIMGMYERETSYAVVGLVNLLKTKMQYCQYNEWFNDQYGAYIGGQYFDEPGGIMAAYLVEYLAEYTRRPQMEFLAKLGHMQVLRDIVIEGKENKRALDWNAQNPADFFRLSKNDYSFFREADMSLDPLLDFRRMKKRGLVQSLKEFAETKKRIEGKKLQFEKLSSCVINAGVTFKRAENYINSFGAGCSHGYVPISTVLQTWDDYLDAAVKLRYDLRRDDVRMPKDLRKRHDEATAAVKVKEDARAVKRYKTRYDALKRQFEYEMDGIRIVIPEGVNEIVREGKVLEHCVGGYAERHVKGAVTILFLRYADFPDSPFVTIELTTEDNCKKIEIRQIHGKKNERDGAPSPKTAFKEFLDQWLGWVHDGSKRDRDGNPVVKVKKEAQTA